MSSVEDRVRYTIQESSLAITITSATSVLSFIVSLISKIPAIFMFCVYSALGLTFTYIFMITALHSFLIFSETISLKMLMYWRETDGEFSDTTFGFAF